MPTNAITELKDHRKFLQKIELATWSEDECSPLKEVIVSRAEHSFFPSEPHHHMNAIMPAEHVHQFRTNNPFPPKIVEQAQKELGGLASLLEERGIKVHRPTLVDWGKEGGYTGSMPRDALLVEGNTIIESCYAWKCQCNEVELAYGDILRKLEERSNCKIIRAPVPSDEIDLFDVAEDAKWQINDSRPAFDAADFIRCGKFLVGQLSHVTNLSGIQYVRDHLPEGYELVLPKFDCPAAMHIDATFIPLRPGLAIYNKLYVTEEDLRLHSQLENWQLVSIVLVEKDDLEMVKLFHGLGLGVITLPFKHVHCLGGSFHCATVDIKRGISGISSRVERVSGKNDE